MAAEFALGGRLGVVDDVLDGLEGAEVGEDGLEVFVLHVTVNPPGHGGA